MAAVVLLTLGLVAAACGGNETAPSLSGSELPTVATAPATAPDTPSTPATPFPAGTTPAATGTAVASCPAQPWTLASLVDTPALPLDPAEWSNATLRRAGCFGSTTVRFDAFGGAAMNVTPGVTIPPAFGDTYLWFVMDPEVPGSKHLFALIGPGPLGQAEQDALERTWNPEPGVGGGTWWRVTGAFDDPAARECRPNGPWYLDAKEIEYTPAQAVEVCRELFVIHTLEWLPTRPAS